MFFSHFNSASTYSGPAAIRVLRSTCGQTTHKALYDPAPGNCYLMSSLQKAGYERNLGLNHNGQFGGFLQTVQTQGGLNINPMPIEDLQIDQHAFDGSPVHDDLAVLSHWLDLRSKDKASRVALYYNTISLHDGNHLIDIKVSGDSIQTYKIRLKKLLDELDQFMQEIDSSGRRALVVMVPEHGAAIRSDKMQIAGLREIPSPAITLVPVGIKVVGPDAHRLGETLQIDKPTSFLAVSYIVEKMLEKSPYGSAGFNPDDYIDGLPTTNYVAQNASATTMKINGHYYLKEGDESWTNYDTGAQP
jgi:cellulose synthase operon protein YhjU